MQNTPQPQDRPSAPLPQFTLELGDADATLQLTPSGVQRAALDLAVAGVVAQDKQDKQDKESADGERPSGMRPAAGTPASAEPSGKKMSLLEMPPTTKTLVGSRPPPPPPPRRSARNSIPATMTFISSAPPPPPRLPEPPPAPEPTLMSPVAPPVANPAALAATAMAPQSMTPNAPSTGPLPGPAAPQRQPSSSSIAPMALDYQPRPSMHMAPPMMHAQHAQYPMMLPNDPRVLVPHGNPGNKRVLLFGGIAAALFVAFVAGSGVALFARGTASPSNLASASRATTHALYKHAPEKELAPRVVERGTVTAALTDEPSAPAAAPAAYTPSSLGNSLTTPALTPTAPVSHGTGTLKVPASVKGLLIDGKPRKVEGSTVVSCGKHLIKAGITPARTVDVPCGGTLWL